MAEFVDILLSVPTVLFAVPLALAVVYWGTVVAGALDIGVLDSLDGAVDGAVEAAVDGAADAAVDAAIEGSADAAVEGAEAAAKGGPLLWIASVFRLGRVPATVSLTAFLFWGWVAAFLLTWLALRLLPELSVLALGIAGTLIAAGLGAALTHVTVRPLEGAFHTEAGRRRASLLGEVCEITTGTITPDFGQACALVGADHLDFQVRCDREAHGLRRGDLALIVSYDARREAFIVEPLAAIRSSERSATRLPSAATTAIREA